MNIDLSNLDTNDILGRWNDYAQQNGGHEKALSQLPEEEREALYELTNVVKGAPFSFSRGPHGGFLRLATRLESSHLSVADQETAAKIQKAMLHIPGFAKSALRDRVAEAKSYIDTLQKPKSLWGPVYVSQNTLSLLLNSLLQRADLFDPEVRDAFEKTVKSSVVYQSLQQDKLPDVAPLIPQLGDLLDQLDRSLSN